MFGIAVTAGGEFLRDAAIDAAYELGVFTALARLDEASSDELADAIDLARGRRRLRALLDVLAAVGAIGRRGDLFVAAAAPKRPVVARAGWGLLADVIRRDKPLHVPSGETTRRFHKHLASAGAAAAHALARLLPGESLLDIGGGAGTYTAAFLDGRPGARATVVELPHVLEIAREELARFADRVTFVEGDARVVELGSTFDCVLLANVLHLYSPSACAELLAVAARAGKTIAIKDLRVEQDRSGPLDGLLFALNMAIYTDEGDVYPLAQIVRWLEATVCSDVETHTVADAIVILARKPRPPSAILDEVSGLEVAAIAGELDAMLARTADLAWSELERDGTLRADAAKPELAFPRALRHFLAHAVALERADCPQRATSLERHYTDVMPRMRIAHLASTAEPSATFFHARLDWAAMPSFTRALDRLFVILGEAGVDPLPIIGHPSAAGFRANTPTLASLYERTYYGKLMPLLYGYPADLAAFARRGADAGHDTTGTIDHYLTGPLVHELCHFAPDREALPPYLDECISGWLGVHVHPAAAYPSPGDDNAIMAAPLLAQVGQALARAFGVRAVVRAHAGIGTLPSAFVNAAIRIGWADWAARRNAHFLGNTLQLAPWIALALAAASGRDLDDETYESLAVLPIATLPLPEDPDFDRAIVCDALRAMCLYNERSAGSFFARAELPQAPIVIEGPACRVTTARRGELDTVDPSYWLPPAVAARIGQGYVLRLADIPSIPDAADAICTARPIETRGFTLAPR